MRFSTTCLAASTLALLMAGCVQHQSATSSDDLAEIRYEVGPCYGTCPVYSVAVEPDGTTRFIGERHTAVKGERARANSASTFNTLQEQLAPWQPAMGKAALTPDCGPRASDLPYYTMTWVDQSGDQAVLKHDTGCHSENARELTEALRGLSKELNIEHWVQK